MGLACTMAHKIALEALDRTLQDIRDDPQPMGGLVVLLAGDFRQTLPVVTRGTPADELNACLKSSYLWSHIVKMHLKVNMRVQLHNDTTAAQFADELLKIGEGTVRMGSFPVPLCTLVESLGMSTQKNEDTVALRKFREQIKVELGAKDGDRRILTDYMVDEEDLGDNRRGLPLMSRIFFVDGTLHKKYVSPGEDLEGQIHQTRTLGMLRCWEAAKTPRSSNPSYNRPNETQNLKNFLDRNTSPALHQINQHSFPTLRESSSRQGLIEPFSVPHRGSTYSLADARMARASSSRPRPKSQPCRSRKPLVDVKNFNSNSSKAHQYQPFPRTAAATHHQQEPHKSINQPPYPCKICASHQLPNQIHFHRDCPLKNNNHPKRINPEIGDGYTEIRLGSFKGKQHQRRCARPLSSNPEQTSYQQDVLRRISTDMQSLRTALRIADWRLASRPFFTVGTSAVVFAMCSAVVAVHHFLTPPIACVPVDTSQQFLDTYCMWHLKVGGRELRYYGKVHILLFGQAALFAVPLLLWSRWGGGDALDKVTQPFRAHLPSDERRIDALLKLAKYIVRGFGDHGRFARHYITCEALSLLSIVFNILWTLAYLGKEYVDYGVTASSNLDHIKESKILALFPSLGMCDAYRYSSIGNVAKINAMCSLPLNAIHVHIYMFLWFWFLVLILDGGVILLIRLMLYCSPWLRAAWMFKLFSRCDLQTQATLRGSQGMCCADWLFLHLLSLRMERPDFEDLLPLIAGELDHEKDSLRSAKSRR
ncbi:hypothetical protein LAZ67_19001307 [Cordylochernes scorpioides]|uniref:Multifunctional fusion protein n=1 Tax=Cordylochernes scorpioides TaxID=51811 RepID=A0ABY6LHU6_9ARAC|nr:hypothetical protein LAZ67_19001307 [Cordylochernes scorpioides]